MKLITAIAALALVAGSMDVEAQKRGKPHISPVAHFAIQSFGALEPEERQDLAEAVEEGDEEALEELQLAGLGAIEVLIDALKDEESRELIKIGMMLGTSEGFGDRANELPVNMAGKLDDPVAIEVFIDALEHEESRELIKSGMMLGRSDDFLDRANEPHARMAENLVVQVGDAANLTGMPKTPATGISMPKPFDEALDKLHEQLEGERERLLEMAPN